MGTQSDRHLQHKHKQSQSLLQCEMCPTTYHDLSQLNCHQVKVHGMQIDGAKSFVCPECNKVFPDMTGLNVHLKCVHKKARDFACDQCTKTFFLQTQLTNHVAFYHQGIRNFVCRFCSKDFPDKPRLNRHESYYPDHESENTRKTQAKKQLCIQCGKKFWQ